MRTLHPYAHVCKAWFVRTQEYEPTPLSSFGVSEVFCSGAFLRVALEERHVVEERERALEAARLAATTKVKAMLQSPLPSHVSACAIPLFLIFFSLPRSPPPPFSFSPSSPFSLSLTPAPPDFPLLVVYSALVTPFLGPLRTGTSLLPFP